MRMAEEWLKTWICLSLLFAWTRAARPRFDVSTDMGLVLVPMDAEVDSVIFRLRATDQDADFPLIFEIIATTSPIVRVENLPCSLYNKVCQANVILTRRLVPGRLHDFVVRVRDTKGDMNSMQATISVTNATTPRERIFPHTPSLIMVPEDTKPEKELDYLLVESNPRTGKPVYIELWQPRELFKIRQRQMGSQTKGIITLIGELDFETQSMYTLTMYATDPYTETGKDTRNIAGLHVVLIVQDVQDVPPVFTLAPPLTKVNNSVKPGDTILRVHAEDGDKGVPREITYGLVSEGNPFTPFFNVSETTGEIILARPLEELIKITHVGAPIVLKIVAEEIRTMRDEPPAQATVVEVGLLLGEPGNSPPYFENDNYIAWLDENAEPGTLIMFTDAYSTRVKDEDIGKAGVFALKLENNNGTFEISPAVAEKAASFAIAVRDNSLIDYEKFKSLRFRIVAQEVGPATNLSTSVPATVFLRDINDNLPVFDVLVYEVTLSEDANAGTRVIKVHATDSDSGAFGRVHYTRIIGDGSEAFEINPESGLITTSMSSVLDREKMTQLDLTVEARDEEGRGLCGTAKLIVNILDVNDNAPFFEKGIYEFSLNSDLTNFTTSAFIKAFDKDAEPPNNIVRYEIVHGNYDNKFLLNEETGELTVREAINKSRRVRQIEQGNARSNLRKQLRISDKSFKNETDSAEVPKLSSSTTESTFRDFHLLNNLTTSDVDPNDQNRRRRAENTPLFILTARAYDLGVPHLSNIAQIRILRPMSAFARTVMFVMPGENPDPRKTAQTLETITGSRVTIQEIKPYIQVEQGSSSDLGKRSVVVARVENGPGTLVDVEKIRESLTANGFGLIGTMDGIGSETAAVPEIDANPPASENGRNKPGNISNAAHGLNDEEVTIYKAENKLLMWLLILLGLLILAAIITLISCCICPSCPFYMEPRKRRIHSSETLIVRSDGRPKRHLYRKPIKMIDGHFTHYYSERKEAWSADPAHQNWQFNRRNTKNLGISSLPGDIVTGSQNPELERPRNDTSLVPAGERMYMEDLEAHNHEQAEIDSLRRHEQERGSDGPVRNGGLRRDSVREQHFYRDGNAEVLRLVTRGENEEQKEYEDRTKELYHANGKDILLQRFIEDQKLRRNQDLRGDSLHEADVDRSMESHHRVHETAEILILPERLEFQRQPSYNQKQCQQDQMLSADVQRLVNGRNYKSKDFKDDSGDESRTREAFRASMRDEEAAAGETSRSVEMTSGQDRHASYAIHDAELVRQNALLTRLLIEKESRGLNVPLLDTASFLETQSLPGQVAIATQTDRTTATQTEYFARSRSDNEELEEDPRMRHKSKFKSTFETKEDFKKMKTIWVKTPILEENRDQSRHEKTTPTKTSIEVMESQKVSISPDVLKESSTSPKSDDSDDNGHDESDKLSKRRVEVQPDKIQRTRKVSSKIICTNKKRIKDTRVDNDSTTPSPETKEKVSLNGKIRKKIEKPPRARKLKKSIESEKSGFIEPSFRVLEREINNFQQKIRQFGDKKLKLLKKNERDKKDNESDDDVAGIDVTKKCEITVERTRSLSKETSPVKISVEQKLKTSEEGTKITKNQLVISSSEYEDLPDSLRQSSNNREKKNQHITPKLQSRSRSELRRQMHLEKSDTKSSSEKLSKSDDSGKKSDKSKSKSSSIKDESNCGMLKDSKQPNQSGNEKIRKAQTQETKHDQSLKVDPKIRQISTCETKPKLSVIKSKTEELTRRTSKRDEKKDGTKSLTSDESKLSSPIKIIHNKTPSVSEDEKHKQKIKSTTKGESMTLDFNKLVEDVRGVVEKEISSLTQAAKEALNLNKVELLKAEQEIDRPSVSKLSEEQKIYPNVIQKNASSDTSERQDNTEKMKENSKSMDSSSKSKSDDAISFIVIEKNKTALNAADHGRKYDEDSMQNSKLEKVGNGKGSRVNSIKNENNIEKSNAIRNDISEIINDSEKLVSDEIEETNQVLSTETDQMTKGITEHSGETKESIFEELEKSEVIINDKINESKNDISAKIDGINGFYEHNNVVSNEVQDIQKELDKERNDSNEIFSNETDQSKNYVVQEFSHIQDSINLGSDTSMKLNPDAMNDVTIHEEDKMEKDDDGNSAMDIIDSTQNIGQSTSQDVNLPNEIMHQTDEKMSQAHSSSINKTGACENLNEHDNGTTKVESHDGATFSTDAPEMKATGVESVGENINDVKTICEEIINEENLTSVKKNSAEENKIFEIKPTVNEKHSEGKGSTQSSDSNENEEKFPTGLAQLKRIQENVEEHQSDETISSVANGLAEPCQMTADAFQPEETQGHPHPVEIVSPNDANEEDSIDTRKESKAKPSIAEKEEITKSPIKVASPRKPILEVTSAVGVEGGESEDDSSSASDISNKTALRAQPYRTPRHSISSDGGGEVLEKTPSGSRSEGKPRQKWNTQMEKDSLSRVDAQRQTKEASKAIFPQKIEVAPMNKPKIQAELSKTPKSPSKEGHAPPLSKGAGSPSRKTSEASQTDHNQRRGPPTSHPVVIAVKKKEPLPKGDRHTSETRKAEEKKSDERCRSEQRKVEIRSRHLKLHVSHYHQKRSEAQSSPAREEIPRGPGPEITNARSRYMAWYQQKRAEMEHKRREKKAAEEAQLRPKPIKRTKPRTAKSAPEEVGSCADDAKGSRSRERAKSDGSSWRISRLHVKPLVNVESEQLKAIVRQGRRLRRAEGASVEDPPVQIFAPPQPPPQPSLLPQLNTRHHLTQHSEYKFERAPPPFFLHPPPPVPHSSPEHTLDNLSESRRLDDDLDSGIAVSLQGGIRLRHQELLDKKSVFDIAYSEASPKQMRSDSSTPPS